MMECFKLLIFISLVMYKVVEGRVLKDIIDILVANTRTRYMIKSALMRFGKFGGSRRVSSSRRVTSPIGQSNMYGPMGKSNMNGPMGQPYMNGPMGQPNMYGPIIPMIPISAMPPMNIGSQNERDDNEENRFSMKQPFSFGGGFPWRQSRNDYRYYMGMKNRENNQPNVQWKDEEDDQSDRYEPGQQTKANYLQQSPKYLDEGRGPSGLALEVNGDMKNSIPSSSSPNMDFPEPPNAQYFQTPPGYLFGFRANDNNEDRNSNGPLSDKMFRKKRAIIKELKRLFEVLFDSEMGGASMYKQKDNNIRFTRGERKGKINEKKSTVGKVAEGKIFKKSFRPNRRLTLYKRLIGDLNDLIALEIRKTNGNKKIGKVKDSAEQLSKLVKEVNDEETNE